MDSKKSGGGTLALSGTLLNSAFKSMMKSVLGPSDIEKPMFIDEAYVQGFQLTSNPDVIKQNIQASHAQILTILNTLTSEGSKQTFTETCEKTLIGNLYNGINQELQSQLEIIEQMIQTNQSKEDIQREAEKLRPIVSDILKPIMAYEIPTQTDLNEPLSLRSLCAVKDAVDIFRRSLPGILFADIKAELIPKRDAIATCILTKRAEMAEQTTPGPKK